MLKVNVVQWLDNDDLNVRGIKDKAGEGDDFESGLITHLIGVLISYLNIPPFCCHVSTVLVQWSVVCPRDNVSKKLCNRTLHSVESNLYTWYILDIFIWVWNLVSRIKK